MSFPVPNEYDMPEVTYDNGNVVTYPPALGVDDPALENVITEVNDIRTGADGTLYPSAGDAVRDQITDLKEDLTLMGNEESTPINIPWEHGGIDNATGDTNNDGSTTRSRVVEYVSVYDLDSVTNNCPSSGNLLYVIFYNKTSDSAYTFSKSIRVNAGVTYTFDRYSNLYVRFDLRSGLQNTVNVIVKKFTQLATDINYMTDEVAPNTYCRNLVGEDTNVLYPCYLDIDQAITFNTADGEPFGVRLSLEWYDENRTKIDQWGTDPVLSSRTVTNTTGVVIRFMRWASVLSGRHIQTAYGNSPTEYQEYFPVPKNIVPYVEGMLIGESGFVLNTTADNSWNSALHVGLTGYADPCARFSALMSGDSVNNISAVQYCEAFMFFTDPHTQYGNGLNYFEDYMGQIQKVYRSTPVTFAISGGDWLGNSDTPAEASYKLGLIGATCKSMFDRCYMLVGNHDTNYQGKKDTSSAADTTRLPVDSLKNLWFDGDNTYYKFKGRNTTFYCFDTETGTDSLSALNNFGYAQAKWFAESLKVENSEHIAMSMHMIYVNNEETTWCALSHLALQIASAYNTRGTITVDGTAYDFSSAVGMVEFVIAGHTHFDSSHTYTEDGASIPVIITTDCGNGQTFPANVTFDLVFVDYDNRQIKCIRVGSGTDRTFAMASNA